MLPLLVLFTDTVFVCPDHSFMSEPKETGKEEAEPPPHFLAKAGQMQAGRTVTHCVQSFDYSAGG